MIRSLLVFIASLALAACATQAQRPEANKPTMRQQAAVEVDRICVLPEPSRSEEIKKIKAESGLELVCGSQ